MSDFAEGWPMMMGPARITQPGMNQKVVLFSDAEKLRIERDEARAAIDAAVSSSDTGAFNILRHYQESVSDDSDDVRNQRPRSSDSSHEPRQHP